jgi:GNAT superfamily N-acetyltransferase
MSDRESTVRSSTADRLGLGIDTLDASGEPIHYRYLQPSDDIDALTELLHAAYAPLAASGMRFVASHQDAEVTRQRVGKGETIVAVVGSTLIGTITLAGTEATGGSPFYDRPDVASVGQFAVEPSRQGSRIGRMLLQLAELRATEQGAGYLALDTSEHAARLIAFYGRCGFHFVEHHRWSVVNYRSVVMAKALKPT